VLIGIVRYQRVPVRDGGGVPEHDAGGRDGQSDVEPRPGRAESLFPFLLLLSAAVKKKEKKKGMYEQYETHGCGCCPPYLPYKGPLSNILSTRGLVLALHAGVQRNVYGDIVCMQIDCCFYFIFPSHKAQPS
jgi:hypothetical protein